jgi:hypothetical protein
VSQSSVNVKQKYRQGEGEGEWSRQGGAASRGYLVSVLQIRRGKIIISAGALREIQENTPAGQPWLVH